MSIKKLFAAFVFGLMPFAVYADNYSALWQKVRTAQQKDLPKTEITALQQIINKATKEKQYGHLLKAQLMRAKVQSIISSDSAQVELERLEQQQAKAGDKVIKAVYASVLGQIYKDKPDTEDGAESTEKSRQWFEQSLADAQLLANTKSNAYEPALVKGVDSRIFNNDLLHVLGMQAEAYKLLHDYYEQAGNRPAACLSALYDWESAYNAARSQDALGANGYAAYQHQLDSLINVYKDLPEAGELALSRYDLMQESGAQPEQLYNYANEAIVQWKAWLRIGIMRNNLSELQQPMFNINVGPRMSLPDTPRTLQISAIRNVKQLTIKIYKANINGDTNLNPSSSKDYAKIKPLMGRQPVYTITRSYEGQPTWKTSTDSVTIDGLPVGMYVIEATTDGKIEPEREWLRVSNLYLMYEPLPDKEIRYAVVNATTGAPVQGARIRLTTPAGNANTTNLLTTDKNGEASFTYTGNQPSSVWVYTDDDKANDEINSYATYSYWKGGDKISNRIRLYTDRSIYRPGQTVHVAALAWSSNKDSLTSKACAGKEVKFTLYDANGKSLSEKTATTDSYGTASADFVLPTSGLTGTFRVSGRTKDCSSANYFHVETYKRPTFQVTFDKYKDSYKAGDTISARGVATTYSGMPVQGAKVAYTVNRRQGLWWWRGSKKEIAQDSVVTAADGSFLVRVPMLFPEGTKLDKAVYYNFDINAKVTDQAGETHEGTTSLPLSNRTAILSSSLPEKALKDSLRSMTFSYKNLLGEEISGTIRYRFDQGKWNTVEAQSKANVSLTSGKHQLEAVCGNDTLKQDIVVFAYTDKQPATTTDDWFYCSAEQFSNDGKPVYVQFGSSAKATQLYWTVFSADKVLEKGTTSLANKVITKEFKYKEAYGDGITITAAWVVNGELYRHSASIARPMPNTTLQLSWKTFRDKLVPGQMETWTLHIASPNGKPAKAQLLSTLYDKSLDALYKHDYTFLNNFYPSLPFTRWWGMNNYPYGLSGYDQNGKTLAYNNLDFTHFDSDMFDWNFYEDIRWTAPVIKRESRVVALSSIAPKMSRATNDMAVGAMTMKAKHSSFESAAVELAADSVAIEEEEKPSVEAQIRENLNETAFFYPTLMTDANGDVNISFTLPESVTTWRFMGLAHDSLMNNGLITAEAVAKKTVMVQPNMPRFLREGDKGQITTRIFNTSDKTVHGKVRLEIVAPETEKVVATEETTFDADANGTANATFDVNPTSFVKANNGQTLFIARIVAEGKGFCDGEQQYLPVLPDKEMVVNTLPFYQNEAGVKQLDLSRLFPADSKRRKLTIEYTNNPVWLVLQALPTVANPIENDAMSLAAAIYSNVIGQTILTSSPKIAQTIKLWQQETGNETSLTSNLSKNENLKTMLLSETPWVADADKETDQKKQLAGFLDASAIGYRIDNFTQKLAKLQNTDGSFSWWPGMRGSTYMTTAVVETLVRLTTMTGQQENLDDLIHSGFRYLDKEMAKEVAELKKLQQKGHKHLTPSEDACHYLYASALAHRTETADILYLVNLLDKAPTQLSIYGKAGAAVILAQYGKLAHAKEYLQSLSEYTVYKEETGRYFDTPKAQYSWCDYRIPTQTFAIEALQRLAPGDTTTIQQMQRWLLHEKRTTNWSTPINTVNAVYAFISNPSMFVSAPKNNGWIAALTNGNMPTLTLDNKKLDLPKATAGIGYVKIAKEVNQAKTLTIDKTSTGTSWGAVYGQFLQKAANVSNAASGLTIKREITNNSKFKIQNSKLAVGEKIIVRITITADRDYDFVQVQDKRAACLEPVRQLSGYRWGRDAGYYEAPQDNATNFYFDKLSKGKHVIETEYYIDRAGDYTSGICTVQCAYAPEFSGRESAQTINVQK